MEAASAESVIAEAQAERFVEWLFEKAETDPQLAIDMADLLKDADRSQVRCSAVVFTEAVPPVHHRLPRFVDILRRLQDDPDPEVQRYLDEGRLGNA